MMSNKVMVTGGSGFLGAHIATHLSERGDEVVIYDQMTPSNERAWLISRAKGQVKFERGSIEDLPSILSAIKKYAIEKVIHCGAIADHFFLRQNPYTALRVNVLGTINVLEAVRFLQLERIVFASTYGVLTTKQYEPLDEYHPVLLPEGPATGFYGASKVCCEVFGLCYWVHHGVNFIALRPSGFYGFGMQIPVYIKPIIEESVKGEPVKITKGGFVPRDYVYIKDVVSAFIKALDVGTESLKERIFMIGTGKDLVTPAGVAEVVKQILPCSRIEIEDSLPDWDEVKHRGTINIERARDQLGYEPQYDLRRGIEDYIITYREFLRSPFYATPKTRG